MPESRRRLLMTFVGNVGIIAVRPLLAAWQATGVRRSATTASLAERSPSQFSPRPGRPASQRCGYKGHWLRESERT